VAQNIANFCTQLMSNPLEDQLGFWVLRADRTGDRNGFAKSCITDMRMKERVMWHGSDLHVRGPCGT